MPSTHKKTKSKSKSLAAQAETPSKSIKTDSASEVKSISTATPTPKSILKKRKSTAEDVAAEVPKNNKKARKEKKASEEGEAPTEGGDAETELKVPVVKAPKVRKPRHPKAPTEGMEPQAPVKEQKKGIKRSKIKLTPAQKFEQRKVMRSKLLAQESSVIEATKNPSAAITTVEATAEVDSAAPAGSDVPARDLLQTPTSAPGEGKRRAAAVEYLDKYVNNKAAWKFQKLRQVWILRNLWYTHQLNDEEFEMALKYVKNLSLQAREETVEEAKEILRLSDPTVSAVKKGVVEGNKIKFSNSDDEDSDFDDEKEAVVKEETKASADAEVADEATADEQASRKEVTVNPVIVSRAKKIVAALRTFL
ncbi:hypothetical protein HKX48_002987 [Thoreauomyces humboldtii]|nr:hypothetical protein HKX48_002987 [Thoreauomyces humboldtii]